MTVDGDVVMFARWLEECRYQNRNHQPKEHFCGLAHTTSRSGYESDVNLQILYVSYCHLLQHRLFSLPDFCFGVFFMIYFHYQVGKPP